MDWARAIERNSEALHGIAATLFAMLETAGGATRISRPFYRALLRVLHPAEAAVRRLIVIVARGLVVKPLPQRPRPLAPIERKAGSRMAFRLFDPRKPYRFDRPAFGPRQIPRIYIFGNDPRVAALWRAPEPMVTPAPLPDDGLIDVHRVTRRLEALTHALSDLPRQARRLARLRARRAANPNLKFRPPLRPGPPPGHRKKRVHDVDFVLAECHGLAWDAIAADTS